MIPTRARRGGWSLLELLVVMTATATMLTVTAALVLQMLKVGQSERAAVVAAASLERLGRDLRGDARSATGPADVGPSRLLLLLPGGRSVEYTLGPREALRTVRLGGKVEHHEPYRWPRGVVGRFESARDGASPFVALVLGPDASSSPPRSADLPYRGLRIEAVPGRDARLGGGGSR
jgi:type II secretory pathway pseudopilin PulG